jgi:hypothetical protein
VQTFSGRRLNVREDGTVDMSSDDAEYLIRDGWTKLAKTESCTAASRGRAAPPVPEDLGLGDGCL